MAAVILEVVAGRMTGKRFEVADGCSVAIGRSAQCDVQIIDGGISRLHCRLRNTRAGPLLTDLGSSNGTTVNGQRLSTAALEQGDVIVLGAAQLRVELVDAAQAQARGARPGQPAVSWGEGALPHTVRRRIDPRNGRLLPEVPDSPALSRAREQLEAICRMASSLFVERGECQVFEAAVQAILAVTGGDRSAVVLTGEPDQPPRVVASRCANGADCEESFVVSRTILDETLTQGMSVLSSDALADERFQQGVSVVMQKIRAVMCVPLRTDERVIGAIYVDSQQGGAIFGEAELALLAAIGHQLGVAMERTRLVNDLERLFVGAMQTLIATIEAKDRYTRGHSQRVTAYALLIADELGLSAAERAVVELAGVLHDVGKINVPEAVLFKESKLTRAEQGLVRRHPRAGQRIVEHMPAIDRIVSVADVVQGVLHHHERMDGQGYPDGLAGHDIPLVARILAVADSFDAITTDRPYRKGRSHGSAMTIIDKASGTQFDPDVIAAFRAVFERGATADLSQVPARFIQLAR